LTVRTAHALARYAADAAPTPLRLLIRRKNSSVFLAELTWEAETATAWFPLVDRLEGVHRVYHDVVMGLESVPVVEVDDVPAVEVDDVPASRCERVSLDVYLNEESLEVILIDSKGELVLPFPV
jgi:hypothetical protein